MTVAPVSSLPVHIQQRHIFLSRHKILIWHLLPSPYINLESINCTMKYTQVFQYAALLLSLSASEAEEVAAKTGKNAKSKAAKSGSKAEVTCPRDAQHAAAIANRMWGEMWYEIIETGCDCEEVAGVWDRRMTDDMYGNILEPAMEVGNFIPGPIMNTCAGRAEQLDPNLPTCVEFTNQATCGNCAQKNMLSFSAHGAEIDENDCMNFIVKLNEYVTAPQNCGIDMLFATGRTYGWRMNENYVKGGDEPLAKITFIQFSCPFELRNSLVDCPESAGGVNARIDPEYTIFDETPDRIGCLESVVAPCETREECLGVF